MMAYESSGVRLAAEHHAAEAEAADLDAGAAEGSEFHMVRSFHFVPSGGSSYDGAALRASRLASSIWRIYP